MVTRWVIALAVAAGCGPEVPASLPDALDGGSGPLDASSLADAGRCVSTGELCGPGIGECCGSQLCVGDETQPSICVGFDGCLTDGKKNGLETDVDCGRTCRNRPCRAGRACDTMEDCADGLYCPRELRQCTPVPVDGVSCTARSTVSGSWVPRHSPDAPECGSGEACFFRGRHLCVSWGNCRMNQVECCDLGEGGRCYPLGTNQTCPQPRGWCGPRP
jgi:hypothetical protein